MAREIVVLPQPDSPTRPSVSPSAIDSVTSLTACTRATSRSNSRPLLIGKKTRRCSTSISGDAAPGVSAVAVGAGSTPCRGAFLGPARSPRAGPRAWRACPRPRASSGRLWSGLSSRRDSSGGTLRAFAELVRAARPEVAALGPVGERRREPRDRRQALRARAVEPGDRAEQAPGVGVLGVVEDLVERALLDDPAGVHDGDPVGDVGHDAEVVGDQDHGRARSRRAARGCRSRICAWIVTSSAVVGSSAIRSDGLHDSAMAIMTRWRMPPENSSG